MSDFGSRSGAHPSLRHPGRAARSTSGTQAPSLTDEQRLVLQAIFDHFHVHATWPTFISIGRPCVESMASIQRQPPVRSPSRSLCRPGQGTCVPRQATRSDSAYLASMSARVGWLTPGGFVRLLRWLAEQEMAYEPEPGSAATMPRSLGTRRQRQRPRRMVHNTRPGHLALP